MKGALTILSALLLYLAVTAVYVRLAWFIPGRGMTIIVLRLLTGAWVPGAAVLIFYPVLQKKRQKKFATGLILGMVFISLAFIVGALVVSIKFRL